MMTGGHDVSPGLYGEEKLDDSVVCNAVRDSMEKELLRQALEKDMGYRFPRKQIHIWQQ